MEMRTGTPEKLVDHPKTRLSERQYEGKNVKKNDYVIVRTYSAGCFAGTLISRDGKETLLRGARRLWYWAGAASLSELAQRGTSKPELCKFPVPVSEVLLIETIEILAVTDDARKSIESVKTWSH